MKAKVLLGLASPGEKSHLSQLCSPQIVCSRLGVLDSDTAGVMFATVHGCLENYYKVLGMDNLICHYYLKSVTSMTLLL